MTRTRRARWGQAAVGLTLRGGWDKCADWESFCGALCGRTAALVLCVMMAGSQVVFPGCPDIDPRSSPLGSPYPGNCSLYYRCYHGNMAVMACPPNLHFSPASQSCDTPARAGCVMKLTDDTEDAHGSASDNSCAPNDNCVNRPATPPNSPSMPPCNWVPHVGCNQGGVANVPVGGGLLIIPINPPYSNIVTPNSCSVSSATVQTAHPTNCSLFYHCVHGVLTLESCPGGLLFNAVRQVCDWPSNVQCASMPSIASSTTTAKPPTTTTTTTARPTTTTTVAPAACPAIGKCPDMDTFGQPTRLAHQTDCTSFCVCDSGTPKLGKCPTGLQFDAQRKVCDWAESANCQANCKQLVSSQSQRWEPASCSASAGRLGDSCRVLCAVGYELFGSASLTCTSSGWSGTAGLNRIPSCKTPQELGMEIINNVNTTIGGDPAGILFLLDESGSVSADQFQTEKNFASSIVDAFPLSRYRPAGAITFSSTARVNIRLQESNSCSFQRKLRAVRYTAGGTDILKALRLAASEMRTANSLSRTVVLLVTDGVSATNPTAGAEQVKRQNGVLFTIGVANYDRQQLEPLASINTNGARLFFGISSFQVFSVIATYLKTAYNATATANCPP